jgi:hypothetical protein
MSRVEFEHQFYTQRYEDKIAQWDEGLAHVDGLFKLQSI